MRNGIQHANTAVGSRTAAAASIALLERTRPFFTTKPVGVGTGLGLSVSYGIVQNAVGTLSVRNSAEGARFASELPIVPDDQITSDARPA